MSEHNKEIAIKFVEAMGRGDAEVAATCLAPGAFTLAKGFSKFAGVRYADVILGTIEAFNTLVPTGLRPTIHSVTAEGDRVVIEWEGDARTNEGTPYCNQYCMVFMFESGKIKQANEYFCTILAETVLWPLVEKMGGANE